MTDLLGEVRPRPLKGQTIAGLLQQLRAALGAVKPREVPGSLLAGFISGLGLDPNEVGGGPLWGKGVGLQAVV